MTRLALLLCVLFLSACASRKVAPECPQFIAYKVLEQKVRVTPKSGEPLWFLVTKVSDSALYGRDVKFAFSEIEKLEVMSSERGDLISLALDPARYALRLAGVTDRISDEATRRMDCP